MTRRMRADPEGTDLGPAVSIDGELTIATARDVFAGRWRIVIALRPARDMAAGSLVTRDLGPEEVDAVIEGLESARAQVLSLTRRT